MRTRKLVVAAILLLSLLWPAGAAFPGNKFNSHLGCAPSEFVTLLFDFTTGGEFHRVNKNGSTSTSEYVVPDNKVLVVTDMEWNFTGGGAADTTVVLQLSIEKSGVSSVAFSTAARVNTGGAGGVNAAMTAGFVGGTGTRIITPALPANNLIILHGYLAPNS